MFINILMVVGSGLNIQPSLFSGMNYKYWALQKAAWAIDELTESVGGIYKNKGRDGIMEIKGVGENLAGQIEKLLVNRENKIIVKNN